MSPYRIYVFLFPHNILASPPYLRTYLQLLNFNFENRKSKSVPQLPCNHSLDAFNRPGYHFLPFNPKLKLL